MCHAGKPSQYRRLPICDQAYFLRRATKPPNPMATSSRDVGSGTKQPVPAWGVRNDKKKFESVAIVTLEIKS